MPKLTTLLANLDLDSNKRGKQFESICKWYLENDPCYKLQLKRVWLWKNWPQRRGPDIGIDLVAETNTGEFWAIQAKAYHAKYHIKKTDIHSFLSESSTQDFSYRLLIATTNLLGTNAERTLGDQEKPVGRILLHDLVTSDLDWPESPNELHPVPISPKKPFPRQEQAINDVISGFANAVRGQLIMACGTGKTLVGLWVSEVLNCRRTLVLLPSLTLLSQTLREWCSNARDSFDFLPVCSDDTVRGEDNLISKTSELGFPATTDPEAVISFLSGSNRSVVFATYQSSPVFAQAFSNVPDQNFDLIIADEAHRCVGSAIGPFSTVLNETAIKATRRLFMTATPRYFTDDLKKKAKEKEFKIASMDDEKQFGPVFHRLDFAEAIKLGLLSDYQVIVVAVTVALYKDYAENRTLLRFDNKRMLDANRLASHLALIKTAKEHNLRKVITFHSRIKSAKEFSIELPIVANWMRVDDQQQTAIWSKHVSGEMPSGNRDALLDEFKDLDGDVRGFLSNARCLSEGVDVPALDGVAFIDPKNSQVEIIQAVGRAIRKSKDKKIGTIVIPVFIDLYQDSETILETSPFKTVWHVVRALKAHDDSLSEKLDQFRNQLGRVGSKTFHNIPKFIIDISTDVGIDFVDAFLVKIVENSTASWEFWFGLLQRFDEEKGHVNVQPKYETPEGYKLGNWIGNQRQFYLRGALPKERQRTLETLPGWSWAPHQDRWGKAYDHLLEYVASEKHALVPQDYRTPSGFTLGTWVNSQHTKYKKGLLTDERKKRLERLPKWSWNPTEDDWQKAVQCLGNFVATHGHTRVPAKHVTDDGFNLGMWTDGKRQSYKEGKLTTDHIQALENINGWTWNILEKAWNEGFEKLVEFAEREGHSRVPRKHVTDGFKLGIWVDNKRAKYRKNKLPLERQKLLENVKGWSWDPHAAQWKEGFQKLVEFVKEKGTALVPVSHKTTDKFPLGSWVDVQRQFFRKNQLSDEKRERLQSLNGWSWNPLQDVWDKNLLSLMNYVKEFGHSRVPSNCVDTEGFHLGKWVENLRQQVKKGKLSEDKKCIVEKLLMVSKNGQ
ncbi:MAG: Helicase associated domain protein [Desulfomonilaceae bacterium]